MQLSLHDYQKKKRPALNGQAGSSHFTAVAQERVYDLPMVLARQRLRGNGHHGEIVNTLQDPSVQIGSSPAEQQDGNVQQQGQAPHGAARRGQIRHVQADVAQAHQLAVPQTLLDLLACAALARARQPLWRASQARGSWLSRPRNAPPLASSAHAMGSSAAISTHPYATVKPVILHPVFVLK